MSYLGTPEQRLMLQQAMQKLHSDRGVSDGEVVSAMEKWAKKLPNEIWPEIDVRTYNRYRNGGVKSFSSGAKIYEFLSRGPERFRVVPSTLPGSLAFTEDQRFIDAMLSRYSAADGGYGFEQLSSITNTYELFRPSWVINDGRHFVRSELKIEKIDGLYHLSESQEFKFSGTTFEENDHGWVIPYSTNFVGLTNSRNSMKLYIFSRFFPSPAENMNVSQMRGDLISSSGKGPHPSYRFFARIVTQGAVEKGHYHCDAFEGDEDLMDNLMNLM
ncbi:hypothetical protein [Phaeobacter piscinae]|uniref:Uncharacterized protein n=1 Tax=Phaeobacter piscinae TaxID=1580596 RepID=A0AAN1GR52_9RHOB|nr:hypothetical protein [Phaeobacter piscinae]ATG43647.1 hypothetical protein PhaeoP13_01710 [Phaeobacter piscinae]